VLEADTDEIGAPDERAQDIGLMVSATSSDCGTDAKLLAAGAKASGSDGPLRPDLAQDGGNNAPSQRAWHELEQWVDESARQISHVADSIEHEVGCKPDQEADDRSNPDSCSDARGMSPASDRQGNERAVRQGA
jgi:hypothetical protein